jgi:hypothetical protein
MMRHFPFPGVILLFILLISCAEKRNVPSVADFMPADSLISQQKMIYILTDVQMIEAALLIERNEGRDTKDKSVFFYDGIFKKYHISRSRYDANMKYYSADPSEMARMYEKIIREIENRQKKIPSKK